MRPVCIPALIKLSPVLAAALWMASLSLAGCSKSEGQDVEAHHEAEQRKIVATSPIVKDVTITEQYVCQIHSCRHIEVRALESGYLEAIQIKEGQTVKQGDSLFKIVPTLYQAKLASEAAEAQLAQIELSNTEKLFQDHVVSDKEVLLAKAKLARAVANMQLAQAELNFTEIKAPFDGIVDRLHEQQGSLIEEGGMLTSLSDNSVMWVYFNVPEARYLEYREDTDRGEADLHVELVLANAAKFPQPGKIGAIEADFNSETGNIAFRADFPNPSGLLRHGQTGNVLIHRLHAGAIVIPQRATFDILDKRYVFVVGEDGTVHQREIQVEHELEDVFVIGDSLKPEEKFIVEGVLQVRDGDKVKCEFSSPEEVLSDLKFKAE